MNYQNGKALLPEEVLRLVQQYAEGVYLYIPRKVPVSGSRGTRKADMQRNAEIVSKYHGGVSVRQLSAEYFLSPQGIYRIIAKQKK